MRSAECRIVLAVAAGLLLAACGTGGKASRLQRSAQRVSLSLPQEAEASAAAGQPRSAALSGHGESSSGPGLGDSPHAASGRDATQGMDRTDPDAPIIMNAVRDEDGQMVATDVIQAATVTARFRNIAERHGRVELEFQVRVPQEMQDGHWQLRFYPLMHILGDSLRLEPVLITGAAYRRSQLKGYQHYRRFVDSIIDDPDRLVNRGQLEQFIRRNLPGLYAFRNDSTEVSEELFLSSFGVSEREAVEHYTIGWKVWLNNYRRSRLDAVYNRYVKSPIITDGIRLDTVIRSATGEFVYNYVQTVATRRDLRRVDIFLDGEIYEQDRRVYTVPRADPLTFYISSLAQFADSTPRYVDRIVERRVSANTACYVDFAAGSSTVCDTLGANSSELGRIRGNLLDLADNRSFDLDSIVVSASASPEGSWASNALLAQRRADAITDYCRKYIRRCRDSISRERGFSIGEDGGIVREQWTDISFCSRSVAEDWDMLSTLVEADDSLSRADKDSYEGILRIEDPDRRESILSREPYYRYLRTWLYPRTRTVRFGFFLHRKGMVKDTVHTTELDTAYMRGVQAISDRDYETAVTLLRPYADYNAAVALCALDYNSSALEVLQGLEPTPRVKYMLSIIHARRGDERTALECYAQACAEDPSLVHRGNLDPEISSLVRKYSLDLQ